MRRTSYSPDLADGALESVESHYQSVPTYLACWESLHPQDLEEWLAAFTHLQELLTQLQAWNAMGRLDSEQASRLAIVLELKVAYESRLDALSRQAHQRASSMAMRVSALHPMVLDD